MPEPTAPMRFKAIAFDLLTALVDSWTLWAKVAGDNELGRRWRTTSLRIVTSGAYQTYEELVRRAAMEVGLCADDLIGRWAEIKPWPETPGDLAPPAAPSPGDCHQLLGAPG